MTPLTMLKIAEKSAHCMRTAIDRFDWKFHPIWNASRARIWYESGRIIDIIDGPTIDGKEYDVIEVNELDNDEYEEIETYTDEDWEYYMYQKDLENAESEEEIYFDSMPDWGDEFYEN